MARIGIGWQEVSAAADELRSEGLEPTVDRVRERLGTGSKSTIAPLLKRWRQEQGSADTSLPDELLQVVSSIHQRLQVLADQKVIAAEQEFEQQRQQWQQSIDQMQHELRQLGEQKETLENRIRTDEYEKIALRQALEESRLQAGQLEVRLQEAQRRQDEQGATIVELRQENRNVREHFEFYQTRSAEERQRERADHQQQRLVLQGQIDQQQAALQQANQDRSELMGRIHDLDQQRQHWQQQSEQQQLAKARIEEQLAANLLEIGSLRAEVDSLRKQADATEQERREQGIRQQLEQQQWHLQQQAEEQQRLLQEQLLTQLRDENQLLRQLASRGE